MGKFKEALSASALTFSLITASCAAEHIQDDVAQAEEMWSEGMQSFIQEIIVDHEATVYLDRGNCALYDAPQGTIIVKNPVQYSHTNASATILFDIYSTTTLNDHAPTLLNGPYRYINHASNDVLAQDNFRVIYQRAPNFNEEIIVDHADSGDQISYLVTKVGEIVAESTTIPTYVDGQMYTELVATASRALCGESFVIEHTSHDNREEYNSTKQLGSSEDLPA
jgi:hypothetical protein